MVPAVTEVWRPHAAHCSSTFRKGHDFRSQDTSNAWATRRSEHRRRRLGQASGSRRNYSQAVRERKKSAVSDHFVRVSREKLGEILERPLDKLKLWLKRASNSVRFRG